MRDTPQRKAVAQALHDAGRPLTAAELHHAAEQALPGLGVATVYRVIKDLQTSGEARRLTLPDDQPRYEWATEGASHAHFVCDSCHKAICLDEEAAPPPPRPNNLPEGFEVEESAVSFLGTCPECKDDE